YSAADFTFNMGIPTYIDAQHAIAHNKVMIIDKETVITGSFNFTKAAEERNAENLLILKNKVRIPGHVEHSFRSKSNTCSGRNRTVIPEKWRTLFE
ncbi:MAG TPA: phospholipase D-like domain-containing protein, partial [Thermodesulfovibrionales bacterium]|nr:phospholipase D-like domain-containing protein [Thermodesulfovibrionales bacterium]